MHRPRFDPKRSLVAARDFTFMGQSYKTGDPFAPEGASDRLRARQYENRLANYGDGDAGPVDPVQMEGPKGGRYTITAPWLEKPEVVRGKVKAEARLTELREEGPPLGFIEGGTAVTIEGGEGGWYEVSAPWMETPEKIQGREPAEARQREIHDAGEPKELEPVEGYAATVLVQQDGDKFTVTAGGRDPETFDTAEEAEARQAELRAGEPPEGWTPETDQDAAETGGENDEDKTVENGGQSGEGGGGDGEGGDAGTVGP